MHSAHLLSALCLTLLASWPFPTSGVHAVDKRVVREGLLQRWLPSAPKTDKSLVLKSGTVIKGWTIDGSLRSGNGYKWYTAHTQTERATLKVAARSWNPLYKNAIDREYEFIQSMIKKGNQYVVPPIARPFSGPGVRVLPFPDMKEALDIVLVDENMRLRLESDASVLRDFFRKLVEPVATLHKLGYAHTNLVPRNFLLKQQLLWQLVNFESAVPLSRVHWYRRPSIKKGVIEHYDAPELLNKNHRYASPAALDVFQLGVNAYKMITGKYPDRYTDHAVSFDFASIQVSPYAVDLLQRMLCSDGRQRITVRAIKQHPLMVDDVDLSNNTALKAYIKKNPVPQLPKRKGVTK